MAKKPAETLGSRIRAIREKKGLSGRTVALKAGISQPYLWQIENQPEHDPKLSTVVAIAAALEVPISQIVPKAE